MNIAPSNRPAFPKNVWYVAGFGADLSDKPIARRICDEPIVFFRTRTGTVAAVEDRCAHRGMPLSVNSVCEGEIIRCGYHGLEFDASGACRKIPGQTKIPPQARIRSYPVVEKDLLLWIWMGDPALAKESEIVSRPYHTAPGWVCVTGVLEVKANWQLLVDNLLNLSHLQYVHRATIGGDPDVDAAAKVDVKRDGAKVRVTRWLFNVAPPQLHKMAMGYRATIDRWQDFEFQPCVLQFQSGAKETGAGAYEGNREGAMDLRHFHAPTPQTSDTTLYHFTRAHNFRIDDQELTEKMRNSMLRTFEEDRVILEAQQARLAELGERPLIDIKDDAASVFARRVVQEMVDAERDNTRSV